MNCQICIGISVKILSINRKKQNGETLFLNVMSKDLKSAFPGMSGFSVENLKHIRYWYRFYSEGSNRLQLVTQFETLKIYLLSIQYFDYGNLTLYKNKVKKLMKKNDQKLTGGVKMNEKFYNEKIFLTVREIKFNKQRIFQWQKHSGIQVNRL